MVKLVIIGAGASGLAAAAKLVKGGFDQKNITILEAQDRIGGRIHTTVEGGRSLELGAQWVHGEDDNVAFKMASAVGELNSEQSWESSGLGEDVTFNFDCGTEVPRGEVEAFLNLIESIKLHSINELTNFKGSLGEFFVGRYLEEIKKYEKLCRDPGLALAVLDWYHLMQNVIDGSDSWFETCGPGHLLYQECPGNPLVTWKRGYSAIFDILMKDIPKLGNGLQLPLSDRVLFKKAVSKIYWSVCDNEANHEETKARLLCEDGSSYEADIVLFTCSLGVLKASAESLFVPQLPEQKLRAIQGLGYGTVDKIYIQFEAPWWEPGWCGVSFLRRRADRLDSANEPLPEDWSKNILGFYTVTNHPNFLVGWISGAAARTMESLPANEVLATCSAILRKCCKAGAVFKEPNELIRSTWHSNSFTRGSYSYRSSGSTSMNVFASDLAEPLCTENGRPVVLFAGEATNDRYFSTVHGALESGFREAERILELLKNSE